MSEVLARWNGLPQEEAVLEILPCCGSKSWAATMASKRPLHEEAALLAACDETWRGLGETDWLEAFQSHPRIGEIPAEGAAWGQSSSWSAPEQPTRSCRQMVFSPFRANGPGRKMPPIVAGRRHAHARRVSPDV